MLKFLAREKYSILLAAVLVNVIAAPFMPSSVSLELFMDITFTIVMFGAVFSISKGRKAPLAVSVTLMLPCLFFIWWTYFYTHHENILLVSAVLQALFILYISFLIFISILQAPKVTPDVISGAIVVYLFGAVFFAKLYLILELTYPGSFTVPHEAILKDPGILRYFSMVTISTLGYGDISPVSSQARSMATVEAILGQVYLAVLIARLVSIYGAEINSRKKEE